MVDGTITLADGMLTWKEIEPNTPSITINNAPETLGIGKSTTLTADIKRATGNPTITWTSGDEDIATVGSNSGVVTGITEGNVTITAKMTVDGTKYSDTCEITIELAPVELGSLGATIHGDFINLGVDLDDDGSKDNDWKIVYNDTDNDVVYAYTSKYLKNTKIPIGLGLEGRDTFGVTPTSATQLKNCLLNENAWKVLIENNILTKYSTIEVYGALENGDASTTKTFQYLKGKTNNYYQPSNFVGDGMQGYWIAGPTMSNWTGTFCYELWTDGKSLDYRAVTVTGASNGYYPINAGICPVAIIPSNIPVTSSTTGTNTIWHLITDIN